MGAQTSYTQAWARYRALRNISALLILLFFPFLAIINLVCMSAHLSDYVGLALDAAYFIGMAFGGVFYAFWPCPRCGRSFRGLRPWTGSHCYYCKLPKWSVSAGAVNPAVQS